MAELFAEVEINRESIWPRLSRILAGSIIFHLIVALVVLYVPALRDALYIASLYGNADYVSRDYKKTVIGERATVIDLANDRFEYPEGYFAMVNGEMITPATSIVAPPPVPDVQIVSMAQPVQRQPRVRRNLVNTQAQPSPSASPAVAAASPSPSPLVASASPSPSPNAEEEARRLEQQASANGVEPLPTINTKPFTDLYDEVKQMQSRGEINLDGVIEVTIEADINPDGTFSNAEVTQKTGDAKLVDLANKAVASLGDSHVLAQFNQKNKIKHVTLKVVANDTDVSIVVMSEAQSEDDASALAKALNLLLMSGALRKHGHDEEIFFKSTNATSLGKQIFVNFKMPRGDFGATIAKLSKKATS